MKRYLLFVLAVAMLTACKSDPVEPGEGGWPQGKQKKPNQKKVQALTIMVEQP